MTKKEEREEIEIAAKRLQSYKHSRTWKTCLKIAEEEIKRKKFNKEYMEKVRREGEIKPEEKDCVLCGKTHINNDDFCDECQESFDKKRMGG